MIKLGDYIGQMVSELTVARMQADLEAIRVAELYANHELLRHFPVPRMRLKDIDIDMSVVVLKADEIPDNASPRGSVPMGVMKTIFKTTVDEILTLHNINLSQPEVNNHDAIADLVFERHRGPEVVRVDSNLVADRLTATVRSLLAKKKLEKSQIDAITDSVRSTIRRRFTESRILPPSLMVGVTSKEIREASDESLVRISLKITEEGLEWNHIYPEDGGDEDVRSKLIPE